MKIFFSTSVFILCLLSCSSDDQNKIYHTNGKVKAEYHLKNGELHGKYYGYYPNGNIEACGNYYKGARIGSYTIFHETVSGQLLQEILYSMTRQVVRNILASKNITMVLWL